MGAKPSKVKKHWRLAKVTELISKHLSRLDGIILQALRRKENAVANHLANYEINNHFTYPNTCWHEVTCTEIRSKCTLLSRQDIS